MAVFAWAESSSTALEQEPRVRATQFGDGYVQRAPDGLNHMPQVWQVNFNAVGQAGGDAIIAFFREHGGYIAFDWTPLWASQPIRVICQRWSRVATETPDETNITATFQQDFAP